MNNLSNVIQPLFLGDFNKLKKYTASGNITKSLPIVKKDTFILRNDLNMKTFLKKIEREPNNLLITGEQGSGKSILLGRVSNYLMKKEAELFCFTSSVDKPFSIKDLNEVIASIKEQKNKRIYLLIDEFQTILVDPENRKLIDHLKITLETNKNIKIIAAMPSRNFEGTPILELIENEYGIPCKNNINKIFSPEKTIELNRIEDPKIVIKMAQQALINSGFGKIPSKSQKALLDKISNTETPLTPRILIQVMIISIIQAYNSKIKKIEKANKLPQKVWEAVMENIEFYL